MAEPHTVPRADDRAEETLALTPDLVRDVLEAGDAETIRARLVPLHAADVADLLERIAPDDRSTVLEALSGALDADILAELDETVRGEVVNQMAPQELARAVAELDDDDAVDVVADLDEETRKDILARLPQADRTAVEQALIYEEDTVGRLMQRATVIVPAYWTVGETIDYLRADASLPDIFFDIFVVNPRHRPVGSLPLSRILRSRRPVGLAEIMDDEPVVLNVAMDQEEAAFLFRQQDLTSAPVVDESGRLAGVLTIDDMVDVMDEEHEDDILKLGGVYEDDLYHAAAATAAKRFPWLLVNLATAVLASLVIAQFEATIEAVVALAVLMPIVASMGGNAGTQALTVAVRALATRELSATNAMRIVVKEVLVGGFSGVLFAVIAAALTFAWFGNWQLGAVIAAAMVVNLLVAGLSGVAIPLALDRMRIDPAVASSVVLTTVTDVVGFFAFLGLAAAVLL